MADELRQTPVPVPQVYGQPAGQQTTEMATSTAGDTPALTVEQSTSSDAAAVNPAAAAAPSAEQAASPAAGTMSTAPAPAAAPAPPTASNAASPSPAASGAAPGRTGTPLRTTNGQEKEGNNNNGGAAAAATNSRAASQHPDPGFTMPAEAPPHGAPVRQYLNSKVTGPLLDGMKMVAKEQPKDPLRALGEYLLQRSKELESS